jgi:RNA polymerase sigma factor (TIGR02999 family)
LYIGGGFSKAIPGVVDGRLRLSSVTTILKRIQDGESRAADELLPMVYDELRRIARRHMRNERAGNTLQATALVHEAWMRIAADPFSGTWESQQRFFAAAAEAMRRILVDAARKKSA